MTEGRCSLCGAVRTFDNSEVAKEFRTGVNIGKRNQISLRPFGTMDGVGKVEPGYWSWHDEGMKGRKRII